VLGDLLLSRGGLRVEQAKVAGALTDFHEAYAIFGEINDVRAQASTLMNICYLYFEAKDYHSVIKYAEQARQVYRGDDPLVLASIYNNRALALNELGRYREAEAQFVEALVVARTMKSALLEAQILRNLARTRLLTGKLAEAARTIGEARRVAPLAGGPEDRAADALAAQIAVEQGRPVEAERLIARSFAHVDLHDTQLSSREAHETAYRVYAARGDAARALAHLAALKRLDDEATKLATTTGTALMSARFDFTNQELRIANLQRDEARARVESERMLFLGGAGTVAAIIVLLLVGLFTIRRSRDRVRAVAADLRVSNDALGKALTAKTEFLATTSHEIRTPLNGILGMTEVILVDQTIEPMLRERIGLVHAAGTTMRALVDDILDVAKMETGNLTIEDVPFDPRATLTGAARLWEEQARARGLAFRLDLGDCPTAMLGDAARVRQIAFNLLSNALKFTREGCVGLRATVAAGGLEIAVSDTGIGIPADKLDDVFESFRQADAATTREFGGTGLGLAICRNLARAMDGEITVASEVGHGSTFTVMLPLRPVVAAPEPSGTPRRRAVLIVERNPIARAMLRAVFEGEEDAVAVTCFAEAAGWLSENDAVAIVADSGTLDTREQAEIGTAACRNPAILLCPDAGVAAARASDGWNMVVRPVAGARLVALARTRTVASASDALASRAA